MIDRSLVVDFSEDGSIDKSNESIDLGGYDFRNREKAAQAMRSIDSLSKL
jgi:hypothetical protein